MTDNVQTYTNPFIRTETGAPVTRTMEVLGSDLRPDDVLLLGGFELPIESLSTGVRVENMHLVLLKQGHKSSPIGTEFYVRDRQRVDVKREVSSEPRQVRLPIPAGTLVRSPSGATYFRTDQGWFGTNGMKFDGLDERVYEGSVEVVHP